MLPVVVVLLDGLGDQPHAELGGMTTNEAALTPRLDAFTARAACGLLWPLGRGRAPSSELAHWMCFTGSLESFPGRAVLEALGHGRAVAEGDVIGYAALRAAGARSDSALELGARPRAEDDADARALLADIPSGPFGGIGFPLDPVAPGEALLRLDGPAHAAVSDSDSFEPDLHPLLACQALADDPAAARTAAAVNAWTRAGFDLLASHPVNRRRARAGLQTFDVVTTKWWGQPRPTVPFREHTGLRGALVSSAPYQGGIAARLGLDWVRPAPRPDGRESLAERLRLARDLLADGFDFVHCHDKTPDEAAHGKDAGRRIAAVESLDAALELLPAPDQAVVVITGDHATPAGGRMLHSGDPVPFALAGPRVPADRVSRFGESHQADGCLGHLHGSDVLPLALNAADRARFLGARAGRFARSSIGAAPAPALELGPGRAQPAG